MPNEEGQTPEQQAANSGGTSGTYTPPASQADLDRIIADRLSRERGKFADYGDLKAKAEKFDAAEAANQSELEKATKRAEAAEAKTAEYESARKVEQWKADVSKDRPDLRDLLTGTTEADLRTQFDALAARIPDPKAQADQSKKDDGKPHIPYRELSKAQAEAPEPMSASGRLRAAYASSETKK